MPTYRPAFLKGLYTTMQRIRQCEESFVDPINSREVLCPVHMSCGHEAVATGVCAALRKSDTVFGTHRSHGHYLAKGGSLRDMVAEIYCRETGCAKGRGGSMHVTSPEHGVLGIAPIVGGTISLSVGAAMASWASGKKDVSVSFFGDGATGEGVLAESMNFAAIYHLPAIFVCENNLYSTHLPIRECRATNTIFELAHAYGFEGWRVDGNDVLAVYEAAKKAVDLCRAGKGPVLLECMTYRLRGHVGPDDNIQGTRTDIRPKKELAAWRKRDPLILASTAFRETHGIPAGDLKRIERTVAAEVADAHAFARTSPFPAHQTVLDYVTA